MAPAKITLEYSSAAASIGPRPPGAINCGTAEQVDGANSAAAAAATTSA